MKKNVDFKNCSFFEGTDAAFTMIAVQGGTFNMGSDKYDDEKPIHSVELGDFWIGQHLVTQALWKKVMLNDKHIYNPSLFKGDTHPVERVSWEDINDTFLVKLNEMTIKERPVDTQFWLPTEAQWEYAARGGEHEKKYPFTYSGSDKLHDVGWYGENSHGETKPVGLKLPNLLGIYDMSGNTWEWCSDLYVAYKDIVDRDLQGTIIDGEKGRNRVVRGSGYLSRRKQRCRVSDRNDFAPALSDSDVGFRFVLFPSV
jgi:formylglycine-generating enzyme